MRFLKLSYFQSLLFKRVGWPQVELSRGSRLRMPWPALGSSVPEVEKEEDVIH